MKNLLFVSLMVILFGFTSYAVGNQQSENMVREITYYLGQHYKSENTFYILNYNKYFTPNSSEDGHLSDEWLNWSSFSTKVGDMFKSASNLYESDFIIAVELVKIDDGYPYADFKIYLIQGDKILKIWEISKYDYHIDAASGSF
ncbi:MAG: hypothetical protein LBV16_05725 [Elusimicrobiota bacterium]|nr:hypothetical protein [Elusimicrobiota bacterium]